ncbi:M48 family metalloprotease [Rubellimicrobium roseum]|uniref:Peptidase M48 n=1 Tax=Rubellimicrobium roseum TaxID=687525 RepID=A0A5C4NIJ2_9RHOB|nr:M48 family metalloprotease [Rubellimicrobium roseum]TNC74644.1 peptidase M48 [Rubellimicrobium roseum]
MRLRPLAVLAACLLLAACGVPGGRPVPVRPDPAVVADGQGQARAFLEVVDRVEPVAEAECARRNRSANCDFLILVDDRPGMPPNAFQTLDPQGRPVLAFTVALIAQVRNADELALVMAHEASHHIAGHLARQDRYASVGAAVFGQLASRQAGATAESIRQAQLVGAQVAARSYSKEFELEADRLGTRVTAQAGFDPLRGALFFLRLPDPGNRFLGTHPSNGERMAVIQAEAAALGL